MSIFSNLKGLFNKKNLFKFFIELLIIVLLIVGVQYWRTKDMLASDGTIQLTPVEAVTLQGEQITLFSESERTLLYFFAPWCQVCGWSIGSLEKLTDTDLNVVAIAMDYETLEEVERFVQEHEMNVEVALGNRAIGKQFGIKGYPSYYLLDEQQTVVARHFGFSTSMHIKLQNWMTL